VAVKVIASLRQDGSAKPLVTTTVDLRHENQELTALRRRLDAEGALLADSVSNLFKLADSVSNLFKDRSEASRRFRA
jgi:hypothetical protein